ncbi:hypothetical protein GQ457_15G016860 [Hibiscus cannabinus]
MPFESPQSDIGSLRYDFSFILLISYSYTLFQPNPTRILESLEKVLLRLESEQEWKKSRELIKVKSQTPSETRVLNLGPKEDIYIPNPHTLLGFCTDFPSLRELGFAIFASFGKEFPNFALLIIRVDLVEILA